MPLTRTDVNTYFHGTVDIGDGASADYVVAHGARQQQRGRKPSVAYRDISNPELAFETAQEDIKARTTKEFKDRELPGYLVDFSGRIAIMHVQNDEYQRVYAGMFADARMYDGRCVGAVILGDFDEVDLSMDAHRVNPDGTTEVPYLYEP